MAKTKKKTMAARVIAPLPSRVRIVQDTCDQIAAWLETTHSSISSQHIAAKIRAGLWKAGPFR